MGLFKKKSAKLNNEPPIDPQKLAGMMKVYSEYGKLLKIAESAVRKKVPVDPQKLVRMMKERLTRPYSPSLELPASPLMSERTAEIVMEVLKTEPVTIIGGLSLLSREKGDLLRILGVSNKTYAKMLDTVGDINAWRFSGAKHTLDNVMDVLEKEHPGKFVSVIIPGHAYIYPAGFERVPGTVKPIIEVLDVAGWPKLGSWPTGVVPKPIIPTEAGFHVSSFAQEVANYVDQFSFKVVTPKGIIPMLVTTEMERTPKVQIRLLSALYTGLTQQYGSDMALDKIKPILDTFNSSFKTLGIAPLERSPPKLKRNQKNLCINWALCKITSADEYWGRVHGRFLAHPASCAHKKCPHKKTRFTSPSKYARPVPRRNTPASAIQIIGLCAPLSPAAAR